MLHNWQADFEEEGIKSTLQVICGIRQVTNRTFNNNRNRRVNDKNLYKLKKPSHRNLHFGRRLLSITANDKMRSTST